MLSTPPFRLDGKRALIAGASSGIGQGAAVALGEYGAEVWLMARREDALTETQKMIEKAGGTAHCVPGDVSDVRSIEAILADLPVFDVLVNSAGTARHGPALETKEEDFIAVTDINLKGAYFLTKAVAQRLKDAGKPGSLINISSQMAVVGGIDRSVYCATKHAVEGMTKAMAIEWGELGIRVNTICPTFVVTALTQSTFDQPERRAWIEEKIKLGRIAEVEDLMGPVVFLASDASAMVTGTALLVDGGWTAD